MKILGLLLMACSFFPTAARSETVSSGTGGSIVVEALDPVTGKPIPDGLLKPGMEVRVAIRAYDSAGNSIPCTPNYGVQQGVTGNQIDGGVDPATNIFRMGTGFGSASIQVRCQELPDVRSELNVRNHPPMTAPVPASAAAPDMVPTPAAAPAAGGGAAAGAAAGAGLLVGASIAGGVLLGLALMGSGPEECSTRTCVKSSSCSCAGDSNTTCDDGLPVEGSGTTCTSGNTRVAWCSAGIACVNGVCSSSCN